MKKNASKRSCGSCTACCEGWLSINNEVIDASPGKPCKHVANKGCNIYKTRPHDPCRVFNCSWVVENSPLPGWMKPSKSKAIFQRNALKCNGVLLDFAVPTGPVIPEATLEWLRKYAQSNNRPLIFSEYKILDGDYTGNGEVHIFAPRALKKMIVAWLNAGNKFW